MEILLKLMQANSDIAFGFNLNMEQQVWTRFWKEAEQQLNAAGPPIKSTNDWKKVSARFDLKSTLLYTNYLNK